MGWGHRVDALASYAKYALLYVGPLVAFLATVDVTAPGLFPSIGFAALTWVFGVIVFVRGDAIEAYAERTVYGARVTAIPVPEFRRRIPHVHNRPVVKRWDWLILRPVDVAVLAGIAGFSWGIVFLPTDPLPFHTFAVGLVYGSMAAYAEFVAERFDECEVRVSFRKP